MNVFTFIYVYKSYVVVCSNRGDNYAMQLDILKSSIVYTTGLVGFVFLSI
jgi:hypothetical protein